MSGVLPSTDDSTLDVLTIFYSDVKLLVGELDFGVYVRRHKAKMRRRHRSEATSTQSG